MVLQTIFHSRAPFDFLQLQTLYTDEAQRSSCDSATLQGLNDLFVILKTGANEAHKKLPPHFDTTLRCVPHYGIWSDMEEEIDGHHVLNALDEMDPNIVVSHADFEYYRRLQRNGLDAFTAEELYKWETAPNTPSGHDSPGWRLDKWKFLPMADKAYRQRPEAKWFVFMECDTFFNWRNLVRWLSKFDASKSLYLGQEMRIGDSTFAYGGSGFVISNPAMKALVEHRAARMEFYDDYTGKHWAGDCVLGKALANAGVRLTWSRPTLFSETPFNMNFNDTFRRNKHIWCYYFTSYHPMDPTDIAAFYQFEQKWNLEDSLLRHSDVFRDFVLPQLGPEVADWDNVSTDEQDSASNASFPECHGICERQSDCMQFSLDGQDCRSSKKISLGHQRHRRHKDEPSERMVSGWMMDRVSAFVEEMDASCNGEDWILP
ncbi:uncharacterized protein BCR38DRAFT_335455 [Pseudomassariella vexata]|uniref:N-acetylgalactosaminide beta-1,3-galactosyltransferase n=1 Tax=Pseudomassariella vexata TaxID=1141098 RepID=A0A1Y2EBH3_9PEZI|nr:uncharacterized protein BCR38DRAFT_335455 [Pseudomassariella vexata]ORY68918.1 hypothetical protein BCR38DRAFT_335455 [Pseudomassariella vexata]